MTSQEEETYVAGYQQNSGESSGTFGLWTGLAGASELMVRTNNIAQSDVGPLVAQKPKMDTQRALLIRGADQFLADHGYAPKTDRKGLQAAIGTLFSSVDSKMFNMPRNIVTCGAAIMAIIMSETPYAGDFAGANIGNFARHIKPLCGNHVGPLRVHSQRKAEERAVMHATGSVPNELKAKFGAIARKLGLPGPAVTYIREGMIREGFLDRYTMETRNTVAMFLVLHLMEIENVSIEQIMKASEVSPNTLANAMVELTRGHAWEERMPARIAQTVLWSSPDLILLRARLYTLDLVQKTWPGGGGDDA
jgi:DNA-binding Lrp family transcriptional regulator